MPASPSTARAINDRVALRLLQQEGPLTAGQLKQLTGLSRPTVADLVERLTASGLITVVGESGEQRRGPNARLYGIVAGRAHLAALDVRTEGVLVLVSDLVGRVLAEASVPIGGDAGTGPAVEQAVAAVERTAKEAGADRLHTVGIGAPGLIDPATGDLRDSAGLPAWHRNLAAALQERLPGARVTVENETNLAALAEQREGAARDRDTFVLLWLGHGVGAAVVLDGILRRGASGGTGEIGFLPVPGTTSLPSATDCDGGFHSLTGAAAIGALAVRLGLPAPATPDGPGAAAIVRRASETTTERLDGGDAGTARVTSATGRGRLTPGESVPADGGEGPAGAGRAAASPAEAGHGCSAPGGSAFVDAVVAADGDVGTNGLTGSPAAGTDAGRGRLAPGGSAPLDADLAARFLGVLADRIAVGVASVVAVLDPGCVVLGGEVGQAGGAVLARLVQERLRRMSPLATEVRASSLGGTAVLRGALLTARERAQDELFAPPERR
ncbi:ROK family protein [Streptomyces sp. 1222.5]|uniref:ROK family transcriptional regulator n=1 Tax=unclassified Streptomyces TaxID=2593676 RepID=UPI000896B670|nr:MULTISPECIES: ROK family transcriptional regulator [unclassified Streptomyces]PKW06531.1 ROK family protein [Streptomyces sp. 5112.2]SED10813.1 ROK family protein [Streptomyces sp. 1222.5]